MWLMHIVLTFGSVAVVVSVADSAVAVFEALGSTEEIHADNYYNYFASS